MGLSLVNSVKREEGKGKPLSPAPSPRWRGEGSVRCHRHRLGRDHSHHGLIAGVAMQSLRARLAIPPSPFPFPALFPIPFTKGEPE